MLKLYNHTVLKRGGQVTEDSPASTFDSLTFREIDIVNNYN